MLLDDVAHYYGYTTYIMESLDARSALAPYWVMLIDHKGSSVKHSNHCKFEMTHAYNRIDQRLSEFPEHLVTEAIKRQGFVTSELVKKDTGTFRPSGQSVSTANPGNLEKIALFKFCFFVLSGHYEKRRQEKVEAVLHEVKLLLENATLLDI